MSRENVELVRGLQPGPDVDVATMFRDDEIAEASIEAVAPRFHPDYECVVRWVDSEPTIYPGLGGLRSAWLDWLAPWAAYRTEVKGIIDAGEQVLVLVHDFARREGSTQEVRLLGAAVYVVRDGKVLRTTFYADRAQALKAVGLSE